MLLDLKKLETDYSAHLDEMEQCHAKAEEARKAEDAEGLKTATGLFEELRGKCTQFEEQITEAKAHQKRRKLEDELHEMNVVDANAKSHPPAPNRPPAEPKDEKLEMELREKAFFDFMVLPTDQFVAKSESRNLLESMRPRSDSGFRDGMSGIVIPKSLSAGILPESFMFGKAMPLTSTQTSPASLIPQEFKAELLRYPPESPHIYPRTRHVPTKTGTITYPRLVQGVPGAMGSAAEFAEVGGVACKWTAEAGEKEYTEPEFEQLQIATHELCARTEISRTLLGRSFINLESFMRVEFRNSILHRLDNTFLLGSGTGQPLGIFNDGSVQRVPRQTAGQVTYNDLVDLEHAIAPQLRAGAIFVAGDSVIQHLKKKKDAMGRPMFVANPGTGAYTTLLGYPYVPTQRLSLGENDVVFGNWTNYITPIEQDIVVMKSEHRKIELNVIVYVVFILIGGRAAQGRAFSILTGVGS